MDTSNNDAGLSQLVNQVDSLILQHLNYLNKLEDACSKREKFGHKQATECNFGKLFYAEVWPTKSGYPDEIKRNVEEIEQEHKVFHATAGQIDSTTPLQEQLDATSACKLILKLYHLEELVKGGKK